MKTMHLVLTLLLLLGSPALRAAENPLAPLDSLGPLPSRPTHEDCARAQNVKSGATAARDARVAEASARATGPLDPAAFSLIIAPLQEMAMDSSAISTQQALLATVTSAEATVAQQLQQTLRAVGERQCKDSDKSCHAAKKAAGKAAYSQAASQLLAKVLAPYQAAEQAARLWIAPREARLEGLLNLTPPTIAASSLAGVRSSNWLPVIGLIDRRLQICNQLATWVEIAESND